LEKKYKNFYIEGLSVLSDKIAILKERTSHNNVLPTLGNMHVIRARRQYAGR